MSCKSIRQDSQNTPIPSIHLFIRSEDCQYPTDTPNHFTCVLNRIHSFATVRLKQYIIPLSYEVFDNDTIYWKIGASTTGSVDITGTFSPQCLAQLLSTVLPSVTVTVTSDHKLQFAQTADITLQWSLCSLKLQEILGVGNEDVSISSASWTAPDIAYLAGTSYLVVHSNLLPSDSIWTGQGRLYNSIIVPLTVCVGDVQTMSGREWVIHSNRMLSEITIDIYDQWGNSIDFRGAGVSFLSNVVSILTAKFLI